jgi:lathosterol oxidase
LFSHLLDFSSTVSFFISDVFAIWLPHSLTAMDIALDILDELVLDRLYAAALPLAVFLPKAAANITASALAPAPSLWTSVVSSLPHPPPSHAADAALRLAALPSSLPSWLLKLGAPAMTASAWPRDYIPRQLLSLTLITLIGIHVLYFLFATLSYYLIFDHDMMKHPKFLKVSSIENVLRHALTSNFRTK